MKEYIKPITESFVIEHNRALMAGHSYDYGDAKKKSFWFDDDDDMSVIKKAMKNADTGNATVPGSGHSSFKPNLWDDDED